MNSVYIDILGILTYFSFPSNVQNQINVIIFAFELIQH